MTLSPTALSRSRPRCRPLSHRQFLPLNQRAEIWLVKYYPILANGVMLCLLLMQLLGIEYSGVTSYLFGLSLYPAVLLWFYSKRLHFCAWHRVLIGSLVFFAVLQILWRCGVKYDFYLYIAIISTIICIIVATFLYFVHGSIQSNAQSLKVHRHGFGVRRIRKATTGAAERVKGRNGGLPL